jgi:5-oxoprolinase (ATP-hydrolysing)
VPLNRSPSASRWQFWIDRGGTFTDVVARAPDGRLITEKLLSDAPEQYRDAAVEGVRRILGLAAGEPIPAERIAAIKMGTTVATNALLQRRGEPVVLAITRGFADALRIGYQNRPQLFARRIVLPDMLYDEVVEIDERIDALGRVLTPLEEQAAGDALAAAAARGLRAVAIVLMHGYRYTAHEQRLAEIARDAGFTQISISHEMGGLMRLVPRGDTTVVDAYLTPVLRRYVDALESAFGAVPLMMMQSNGGLTGARRFQGKDAILSGPAGGVVSMVETARQAGFAKVIGFDMGGTSTDVSHFDGEYERSFESEVAGVRICAPMMRINTVAAGGGSILYFDGARFRAGPESAGADPGPACYRRGGPLTVTDANVLLGRIQPDLFPSVFGPDGRQSLDAAVVHERFAELADEVAAATGEPATPETVADGFLAVAINNMANAIKQISVQRGYDVTRYVLNCFGGAAGQHACRIADQLGLTTVLIHPLAGVLSAYGMGLAQIRSLREQTIEAKLTEALTPALLAAADGLSAEAMAEVAAQGVADDAIRLIRTAHLKYQGTDTPLPVALDASAVMADAFARQHHQHFGFVMPDCPLVVDAVSVEAVGSGASIDPAAAAPIPVAPSLPRLNRTASTWLNGAWQTVPIEQRSALRPGDCLAGPAILVEATSTTVVEPGWRAEVTGRGDLLLTREQPLARRSVRGRRADPVMLEVFNSLFMSVAEQMGAVLAKTARSVNIKERFDFSCAVFDAEGALVANAPHVPVHLGSMSDSVARIIGRFGSSIYPGDAFVLNAPYAGGTHLPDITVISPVFDAAGRERLFFVGARGHHADIGGISPGSMPPGSRSIDQEGVLIDAMHLVSAGRFEEAAIRALLTGGPWPARNPEQNIADLKAQIAANTRGIAELRKMVDAFGLDVVQAYMGHVQDNAEAHVRRVIGALHDGTFRVEMDSGAVIKVAIRVDHARRSACIDFTGTAAQQDDNLNAPPAIAKAAVLYVFRTLVDEDIPLNAGCLKPLRIIIPAGSMLAPRYPAAVVAGNVETSQAVTNALYGALGVMAAAQGTMNNFTFGNARHQYYETICGGAGAGADFDGADAVHTHMTNTRLTDPEVLEWRFPVLLRRFAIRRGSGGRGRHRGGCGVIRAIEFREPMQAGILSNHRRIPPFGLNGGAPGECGHNRVIRADGTVVELPATASVEVDAGDVFVIETPGGGGYGG